MSCTCARQAGARLVSTASPSSSWNVLARAEASSSSSSSSGSADRLRTRRRLFSSTARQAQASPSLPASISSSSPSPSPSTSSASSSSPAASSSSAIHASLLLSRPPFLTRTPDAFEAAFFRYNARLHRALAQPFSAEFYFKKGSAAEAKFSALEAERVRADFQQLQGKAEAAGGKKGKKSSAPQQSSSDSESAVNAAGSAEQQQQGQGSSSSNNNNELYAVLPRRTAADEAQDLTSLERSGERTLYLLVRDAKLTQGKWRFPAERVQRPGTGAAAAAAEGAAGSEGAGAGEGAGEGEGGKQHQRDALHDAAPRAVRRVLGAQMDVWLVTRKPAGLHRGKEGKVSSPTHSRFGSVIRWGKGRAEGLTYHHSSFSHFLSHRSRSRY